MRFLVDEDLPRSLSPALRAAGHEAVDVREIGLRGRPDDDVFRAAQERGAALVSGDRGFANIVAHPPGTHAGVVLAHFPNEVPTASLVAQVLAAIGALGEEDVAGNLVMIEPGRVRIRRTGAI